MEIAVVGKQRAQVWTKMCHHPWPLGVAHALQMHHLKRQLQRFTSYTIAHSIGATIEWKEKRKVN